MITTRTVRIPSLAAMLFASLLPGCDGDDACGPRGEGRILGQVIGASGPVGDCVVYVTSTASTPGFRLTVSASTDAEGRFDMELPPGGYILRIKPAQSYSWTHYATPRPTYDSDQADTLRVVSGRTTKADFFLGGLSVQLALPPQVTDGDVWCHVRQKNGLIRGATLRLEAAPSGLDVTFDALVPDTYAVNIDISGGIPSFSSEVWLPHSMTADDADSFIVVPQDMITWQGAIPVPGYVRGVVQSCWLQAGYDPPSVSLYGPDRERIARRDTDTDGTFEIPVFAPGAVRVSVWHRGYSGWIGGTDFDDAQGIQVGSGITVDVDPMHVSCVVFRLVGQIEWGPLDASFALYRQEGDDDVYHGSWPEGCVYTASGLEPGTYFLRVSPYKRQVWRFQWYDRSATRDLATPIVIEDDGDIVEFDVILEEGGRIRGRLLDPTGEGAPEGVGFTVLGVDVDWSSYSVWETDSEGYFLIQGLPDGGFQLGAPYPAEEGIRYSWYPGVADPDSAEVITISGAAEVSGIEWQVQPAP